MALRNSMINRLLASIVSNNTDFSRDPIENSEMEERLQLEAAPRLSVPHSQRLAEIRRVQRARD